LAHILSCRFVLQSADRVFEFGGDIQKFAGDAFFAEWRESKSFSIDNCVAAAAECASSMVKECSNCPILTFGNKVDINGGHVVYSLNIHCGLGVGEMIGIHVGDSSNRREYLYIGDPINQATKACDGASIGEVVISEEFSRMLANQDMLWSSKNSSLNKKSNVIATQNESRIMLPPNSFTKIGRNAKSRGITEHVDGLQVDSLIEYRRLMSLYVHPVVVSNDVAASNDFCSTTVQERRKDEAELRSVYVMFVKPLLGIDLNARTTLHKDEAIILNNIMNVMTRELKHYCGHLRQFVVDDKGFVLIATFGLRGSTYPNMISERALPATLSISQALDLELGVKSKIGATFGGKSKPFFRITFCFPFP
jgi:Adenylate and Guanylate cyclase catalytic domain